MHRDPISFEAPRPANTHMMIAATSHPFRNSAAVAAAILGAALAAGSWAADAGVCVRLAGEPGAYTVARWKRDWPGCRYEDGVREGRVAVVQRPAGKALRITCAAGRIGPAEGGAGWRWPVERADSLTLTYTLRFDPDFEFVKGGKLPGLAGGPESVTGGRRATGTNGFSVRLMWRRDGRAEAYVYHVRQPDAYGESLPFPDEFRFPRGEPVQVRLHVVMNAPGRRDGQVRVWIRRQGAAEQLVVERRDMEWRTVDSFATDSVLFAVFHGGNDAAWAPTKACGVEIGEIRVDRE